MCVNSFSSSSQSRPRPIFHEILHRLADIHDKKARDYGVEEDPLANLRMSSNAGIEPWKGVVVRLGDKYSRLCTAARTGRLVNENVEDTFLDMAIYAILGLIMFREGAN